VLSAELRERIADAAVALGRELGYRGPGPSSSSSTSTRRVLVPRDQHARAGRAPGDRDGDGVDIVREQLRIAAGEPLWFDQGDVTISGHAIECRINAESVDDGFLPSPGTLTRWEPPVADHVRVDTHGFEGYTIPPYYDSLIAKLIVTGDDRAQAIDRSLQALAGFGIDGVDTTCDLHRAVLAHADFRNDTINTRWLERRSCPGWHPPRPHRSRTMAEIDIIDQTLRDGQQSLWGMRMKVAHLADIADDIEHAGYRVVDLTGSSIFECMMRYNREDPWDGLDLWRTWMPTSKLRSGSRSNCIAKFGLTPDSLMELWIRTLAKHGIDSFWIYDCLYNMDAMERLCRIVADEGCEVAPAIMYGITPVHTDEWFAARVREFVSWGVTDAIYVEDAAGILKPERAKTLLPALVEAAGDVPVEFQCHNTVGVAGMNYLIAAEAGVKVLHTAPGRWRTGRRCRPPSRRARTSAGRGTPPRSTSNGSAA
jgi:pyruvate carboxylase